MGAKNGAAGSPLDKLQQEVRTNTETIKTLTEQKEAAISKVRDLEDYIKMLQNGEQVETPRSLKTKEPTSGQIDPAYATEVETLKK